LACCWAAVPLCAAVTNDPAVAAMLAEVSQAKLSSDIAAISGVAPVVIGGTPYTIATRGTYSGTPITKATQYMYERCAAAGLTPSYAAWGSGYRNVVCEKPGTTKASEIVIVSAHVDDVDNPGADDNGSGTAILLSAEAIVASRSFERTIRFISFTGEEQGALGASAYAKTLKGQNIVGNLNVDMIGYDKSGGPVMTLFTRGGWESGASGDAAIANLFVGVVSAYGIPLSPSVNVYSARNSDHIGFWDAGFAAVTASEDEASDMNPSYHTKSDTLDKLNLDYLTSNAKAVVGTLGHWAGVTTPCTPLAAPQTLVASPLTYSTVGLSWLEVADASSYRLYRSTVPGGPYALAVSASAPALSATDSGLSGSTPYYYVARTVGTGGAACESANSNEAAATTFPAPPKPVILGFTADPATVNPGRASLLSWQTADAVTVSLSAGIGVVAAGGTLSVTPAATTTYTLTATNAAGSVTANATVTVTSPVAAPTSLTATSQSGPQVRLSWRDSAANETGFVVERCAGSGCTAFVQIAAPGAHSGTGSMTFTDTAVTAGSSYTYRVKAVNGSLSSAYSNTATVAIAAPPAVPAAPDNLACRMKSGSSTTVTCSWTDNSNNETSFQAQDSRNASFSPVLSTGSVGANVTSIDDSGLSRGTTYWFRVRSVNSSGASAWAGPVSVKTP
jgi:hypothetical protein